MKERISKFRQHHNPHTNQGDKKPFFTKASDTSIQTKTEQPFFQTKLTVGQPGDKYEVEADAVADAVVNQSSIAPSVQNKEISSIQRKGGAEEEEPLQMKTEEEEPLQLMEEEESLQTKSNTSDPKTASPNVAKKLNQSKGGGASLSKSTQIEMESAIGADFSQVKIHTGSQAEGMNKDLGAQAFTHGKDVYFNQNKFSPNSKEGKRLLAHELTHVVQQNGDVKNIVQRQEEPATQVAENTSSPRELFLEANALYENGEYREAITKFQRLMQTDEMQNGPQHRMGMVSYNIAMACLKIRWVATANYYFEIYKRHNPDREDAETRIAEARQGIGMDSYEVEDAGATDEERATQIFRRGAAHFDNGNYITAIILFERSRLLTTLPPDQKAMISYNIGVANLRLGRYDVAIAYLQEYQRFHPGAAIDEKLREAQQGAAAL
ncbi:MAG: DUF4157 domain-containing protein [Saprospiraceae bacterium]